MKERQKYEIRSDRRKRAKEVLIRESVIFAIQEILLEQEEQAQVAQEQTPVPNAPANQQQVTPPQEPQQTTSVDTVIEKLNMIRGGASFKEPVVYEQLVGWYVNLSDEQKAELNNQLDAVMGIVTVEQAMQAQQQPAQQPQPAPQAQPTQPQQQVMQPQGQGAPLSPE